MNTLFNLQLTCRTVTVRSERCFCSFRSRHQARGKSTRSRRKRLSIFNLRNTRFITQSSQKRRVTCTGTQTFACVRLNVTTRESPVRMFFNRHVSKFSCRERSGSVVECLTQDRRAVGSSLTGVTALWSLSKTHLS